MLNSFSSIDWTFNLAYCLRGQSHVYLPNFIPSLTLTNLLFNVFVAVILGFTSTGWVGLCFLWFYVQELLKAQLAVVLVLKCLRRRGNGLKSHPTDLLFNDLNISLLQKKTFVL